MSTHKTELGLFAQGTTQPSKKLPSSSHKSAQLSGSRGRVLTPSGHSSVLGATLGSLEGGSLGWTVGVSLGISVPIMTNIGALLGTKVGALLGRSVVYVVGAIAAMGAAVGIFTVGMILFWGAAVGEEVSS